LSGTAPRVSTFCLPDVTARDEISQAFPLRICILLSDQILEVGTAWERGYTVYAFVISCTMIGMYKNT